MTGSIAATRENRDIKKIEEINYLTKMNENFAIQLFEGKKVRIAWDAEKEKYYFAVADIVQVLTDSADAKQYIKRMRARDPELNSRWGTICTPTRMKAADGKIYKTQAADLQWGR